jgi:S-methylmethionine-dependent homocysteine/selenocysteine methylase
MPVSLTDGGIETDLIFHQEQVLPNFSAFVLLDHDDGREALCRYYRPYLQLSADSGLPLVLETPTWRASPDWLTTVGRRPGDVTTVNHDAVGLVDQLRREHGQQDRVSVSGCVGPRSDDSGPATMTAEEAQRYHAPQIEALASAGADRVAALTIGGTAEAVGIVRAAREAAVPVVVSFTVETTGLLPDGTTLGRAIEAVDDATAGAADSFMVNCAHPRHILEALTAEGQWRGRVSGVRANASTRSHQEMDDAADLDEGDPVAFAHESLGLLAHLPALTLLGGCCGTDIRHIREIARAHVAGQSGDEAAPGVSAPPG